MKVDVLNDKKRMAEIIRSLEEEFPDVYPRWSNDTFSVLIRTILSQNTSDRNSSQAFQALSERYEIKPDVLAKLDPSEIKPLIRYAGLQEIRSRRIVEVSKTILERFNGDLDDLLRLPLKEARSSLMSLKGVGYKTADIILCFVKGEAVMPIDTNIFRVVNRMGFVKGRKYELVRTTLERLIPPNKIPNMHLLLIRLGREICKARQPLHDVCPITKFCRYYFRNGA